MKRKLISLFTGAGGLDWGFHHVLDCDLIVSNEILEHHLKTYADYYKYPMIKIEDYNDEEEVCVCGDIHDLIISKKTDLLVGGPPCQDFSILRGKDKRAGLKVKRGQLYQEYLRILHKTQPDIFVFENVPGIISANDGVAYKTIQEDLINEGYDLIFNEVINISNIGCPQSRKRLIIIGLRKELNKNESVIKDIINRNLKNNILEKYPLTPIEVFEGEILTNLQDIYEKTIKEFEGCSDGIENDTALKWVETYDNLTFNIVDDYLEANNIKESNPDGIELAMKEHENILKILGYYGRKIENQQYLDNTNKLTRKNKNIIERIHHIPPYYNFKIVEDTPWQVKDLMSNIYRRLHPLIPSTTIIAYGGGGTGGYHYNYNRQGLTNRERARLQAFPDDYLFNGKSSEIRAQIGEALPPIASYWIAKSVKEILGYLDRQRFFLKRLTNS